MVLVKLVGVCIVEDVLVGLWYSIALGHGVYRCI